MSTETKHTAGQLIAHGNLLQSGKFIVAKVCVQAEPELERANAARLAHCWNRHDELVEALRATEQAIDLWLAEGEPSKGELRKARLELLRSATKQASETLNNASAEIAKAKKP